MTKIQRILQKFMTDNQVFAAQLGGETVAVKVIKIDDDQVTLFAQGNNQRYDLHYTQVIFVGEQ